MSLTRAEVTTSYHFLVAVPRNWQCSPCVTAKSRPIAGHFLEEQMDALRPKYSEPLGIRGTFTRLQKRSQRNSNCLKYLTDQLRKSIRLFKHYCLFFFLLVFRDWMLGLVRCYTTKVHAQPLVCWGQVLIEIKNSSDKVLWPSLSCANFPDMNHTQTVYCFSFQANPVKVLCN